MAARIMNSSSPSALGRRCLSAWREVALTEIGRIVNGHKIRLLDDSGGSRELKPHGWEHFKR